ncbi:MAG: 7-cyano-7-deazaguanine synthase QueC [Elusimicrobia bacterium]|nr:7-cyano-7-deazaguanine synthase QueC [Elusimicrobiota bacterium]
MPHAVKRAVVLLSGGLDSATCLWWAKSRGYVPTALSVRYGQRHAKELGSARRLARRAGAALHEAALGLPWLKTSSLVDRKKVLPELPLSKIGVGGVPSTYVPGRNTMFVALGLSLADAIGAEAVVVGANALDYSGYPDCRPAFYAAFGKVARLGTARGASGRRLAVLAPLVKLDKAAIVRLARRLKVPLELTWSCYAGGRRPCGRCDSCKLRAKGFAVAGAPDPAL